LPLLLSIQLLDVVDGRLGGSLGGRGTVLSDPPFTCPNAAVFDGRPAVPVPDDVNVGVLRGGGGGGGGRAVGSDVFRLLSLGCL